MGTLCQMSSLLTVCLDIITQSKPTPVTVNYREIVDKVNKEMENKF